ncbi:MAG: thermonuclease family protein [Pseudomonadota bacterium]
MAEAWAGFKKVEPEAEPDSWEGFKLVKPEKKAPRRKRSPDVPERFIDPVATDGDTIRDGDLRLRLQGIDAPEMGQLGYRSDGSTVPLGEQSQAYLAQQLYTPENLSMAAQAPPSFGRAVAPLMNNGQDVGLSSLRAGQSFAAPEYISDPDMRFDYMEAQRLGRQNRLGVHGVQTQSPKEFRENPEAEGPKTALWFDMPTPERGLTAEQEQRLDEIQRTGSFADFKDYTESIGYRIDTKGAANWFKYRDQMIERGGEDLERFMARRGWAYARETRPLIDSGDGQVGAAARSTTGGFLLGALDEVGAGVDTLGLTPGRENVWNSDRRFGDIYWNNLDQNQSILGYDEANYPTTTTVGEITGNIVGGFAIPYGAGVRSARGLATVGGAFGGAEGFLGTDGSVSDRLTGTAQGVAIGAVGNAALGKGVQAVEPYARRFVQSMRGNLADTLEGQQVNAAPIAVYSPETMAMAAEMGPSLSKNLPRPNLQPNSVDDLAGATARIQPSDVIPEAGVAALESTESPFPTPRPDWAGDSVERIGNIDVSRLDSPQDISRALKTTYNSLGGMDAATRGRMSQAETERLADDLGMTTEQLLSRRQGHAFNAEQALASRRILAKSGNELVNAARRIQHQETPSAADLAAFREMMVRHAAIQEQVAGATAEAGRTLAQFKMSANSRAVTDQVLNGFVRSGGGPGDLKDAAEALIDAAELGPGKFSAVVRDANKPKFRDKVSELYINSLLSNPPTHVVNMVSNSLTAIAQIPEYAFASGIGAARRASIGKGVENRILASEVGARTFGLVQGIKEGAQLFAQALRTGDADDFVSKVEGDQYKAISGLKGEIIRVPTRLLTAEDQLFKGMARRMELNGLAARMAAREGLRGDALKARTAELVANPTDAMLERSMEYGRYLTFQQQLGPAGQGISQFTNNSLPGKVIAPFVRTPINLLKFAAERSPAAPLLKEWREDFMAGGERRDLAAAKMLIGTGFATVFYQAAQQGVITGAAPTDPKKASLKRADGWQPYSIKVGDRYISYARMDPFSTTIGVAADMATLPEGMSDRQRDDMSAMLVTSIMGNLANKSFLSGVSAAAQAVADPQRYADGWLERTGGAFAVPAGVAGVARQVDPVMRERDGVGEAIQSRIPSMSQNLLPRRDAFGEPIELDSLGPDFISPFWQSQSNDDPVIAEMLRIDQGISKVGKQYTQDGEKLDYTPAQLDRYQEIAGRLTYNRLLALIGSPGYSRVDDNGKRKMAAKAIKTARTAARGLLDNPEYPLPPRGQPDASSEWEGFKPVLEVEGGQ